MFCLRNSLNSLTGCPESRMLIDVKITRNEQSPGLTFYELCQSINSDKLFHMNDYSFISKKIFLIPG